MRKFFAALPVALLVGVLAPTVSHAAGTGIEPVNARIDLQDQASLQRGAKLFMNYCVSCHALGYARYERTADDLEIPHDLV